MEAEEGGVEAMLVKLLERLEVRAGVVSLVLLVPTGAAVVKF